MTFPIEINARVQIGDSVQGHLIQLHGGITVLLGPNGVNLLSKVTHYQRPNMTHPQEGGTGGEVSEILFFSAKSKRRPSLIYSMQIIPACLSIVVRRKGVSATRRGGLNWTPISLLVGHPCKLFHNDRKTFNLALDLLSLGNGPSAVSKETGLSRQTLIRIRDNPEAASAAMHRWGL